jgi:uncharacterized protein
MPKNIKKKASKKTAAAVPHNLSELLIKATEARPAAVRQYLAAGGQWGASVNVTKGAIAITVLLFHALLLNHHGQGGRDGADCLELLLRAGAAVDELCIDHRGRQRTALAWASECQCCMLPLQTLLRHGADPCIQSLAVGDSALHFAALYGCIEKYELLITSSGGKALRLRNNVCQTPLLYAALYGQPAALKVLHKHGAQLTARDVRGSNALHLALARDVIAGPQYLLRTGALDVNSQTHFGYTALHFAASIGSAAAVQLLLEHGADANLCDKDGLAPLNRAVDEG